VLGLTKKADSLEQQVDDAIATLSFDGLSEAIYDASSLAAETSWGNAKALLTIEQGFKVMPKHTLEALQKRADDFQFLAEQRERDALKATLTQAMADGASTDEYAQIVKDTFAEGFHRVMDDGSVALIAPTDSWAQTVARTEMAYASAQGQHDLYTEAGVQMVRIQEADPCDECEQWDDQVFPIDDVPEDGPPWHPNCRCVEIPSDEDLGDFRGGSDTPEE